MWMLVRAGAEDCPRTLAACPDTPDRGEPWRWTVRLEADGGGGLRVGVEVDTDHVLARQETHHDRTDLHRSPGEILVVVPLQGACGVAVVDGPWRRDLDAGDVLVAEGEDAEVLRLVPGDGARTDVVRVTSTTSTSLRWVP